MSWEIAVRLYGNAAITVAFPVTTDFDAQDAMCAEDGSMLSSRLDLAVPGPGARHCWP